MSVTTSTGSDPLKELRNALGVKVIGNVIQASPEIASSTEFFEQIVGRLSESIADKVRLSGLTPVQGSGKVYFQQPDLLIDTASIAAKIYAVWSDRPLDLLVFCVQAMEDAREDTRQAKAGEAEYRGRYIGLLKKLASAENMGDVRALVRREDY